MSIPAVTAEVFYDGVWNIVPAQDLDTSRSTISVTYGRPDSHGEAVPTDVSLTLENPDAKWSPKDPNSGLFGKIGKGTPLRVRVGDPQVTVSLPGLDGAFVSTPDVAALDITGDIDVRVDLRPDTWRPATAEILMARYDASWAWVFYRSSAGLLQFSWTTGGTAATRVDAVSTAAVPSVSGRLAVRVTLDVNNGAAGKTVTFYTASTIAGPWVQLGAAVTTAGTTSIFASADAVAVGASGTGGPIFSNSSTLAGRVYGAELYNGIGGALVAAPNFAGRDPDDDTFTDSAGRVWTVHGSAALTDPSLRGSAAIVKFLPAWNETARDARMAITAAGPLNSLGKGEDPPQSSLFHDLSTNSAVVAYWPMEDGAEATAIASGKVGHPAMSVSGAVTFAGFAGFACSQPIPTFNAPAAGAVSYTEGRIPPYAAAADQRVIFLMQVPSAGVTVSERAVVTAYTIGGTAARWVIEVNPAGSMQVSAYNSACTNLLASGFIVFNANGRRLMVSLWLSQVGANINWQLASFEVATGATSASGGTLNTNTYGRFQTAQAGPSFDLGGTAVGHIAVLNDDVHSIWNLIGRSLDGWAGETAGDRMARRAAESDVRLRLVGDPARTAKLGPQGLTELPAQLDQAAEIDLGWLGERRDRMSLLYRARVTGYHQDPALVLDMSTGAIANPFAPPLDDQSVRNDITIKRDGGSSYRAVQETGPNNIQSPRDDPQGIGARYKASPTFNLYSDDQLSGHATWRLALGTVDEHRIATLEIEMEHHPELVAAVLELEAGDLVRITNPVAGLPPGPLDLIALGWTDTITDDKWRVRINCAPGSPWSAVAQLGHPTLKKVGTAHSRLAENVDATATSLIVANGLFESFERVTPLLDRATSWSRSTTDAHAGIWSLRSTAIGDGLRTDCIITIPDYATQVAFWYRVSSQAGFDFFRVLVDGTQVLEDSGTTGGWEFVAPGTIDIGGAATMTLRYEKDGSAAAGLDCVFVDDISFMSGVRWVNGVAYPTAFPFGLLVGGERVIVTDITGDGANGGTQAFTVTRSDNGIIKSHLAGAPIRLDPKPVLGL